jgi:hypothetical protein
MTAKVKKKEESWKFAGGSFFGKTLEKLAFNFEHNPTDSRVAIGY